MGILVGPEDGTCADLCHWRFVRLLGCRPTDSNGRLKQDRSDRKTVSKPLENNAAQRTGLAYKKGTAQKKGVALGRPLISGCRHSLRNQVNPRIHPGFQYPSYAAG